MYKLNCAFLLIVVLFSASLANAQKTPPKAAVRDTWKEFVSQEGGFRAKFPVPPTRVVTQIDTGFGKADFVQFRVMTRSMNYLVAFLDFPAPVTDPEELKVRYDNAINNVVNSGSQRLVSMDDIYINDYLGREAVFESATMLQTQRAYIINQRFFAVAAILPITRATTAKTRADYNELKAKFFESFAVTKIPEAKNEVLKLPEDFGSSFEENTYRSAHFGFSMTLPEKYRFFDNEQLNVLKELTSNEAALKDPTEGEKVKLSVKRTALLAGATAENQTSIIVAAELPSFPNMKLEAITAEIVKEQKKNLDEKIVKPLHPLTLGGVKAYGMISQNVNDKVKQYLVLALRKDLIFQIVFSYKEDSELAVFTEVLKDIKFEK